MKNVVKKLKQTLKYSGTLLGSMILLSTVAYGQQAPAQQYSCSASFLRSEGARIEQDIERQLALQMQEHFSRAQQIIYAHLQGTPLTEQHLTRFCPHGTMGITGGGPFTLNPTLRPDTSYAACYGEESVNLHVRRITDLSITFLDTRNIRDPQDSLSQSQAVPHIRVCIAVNNGHTYQINGRNARISGVQACIMYNLNTHDVVQQNSNIINSDTGGTNFIISNTLDQLYPRCRRRSDEGSGSGNGGATSLQPVMSIAPTSASGGNFNSSAL